VLGFLTCVTSCGTFVLVDTKSMMLMNDDNGDDADDDCYGDGYDLMLVRYVDGII
jgi:hypothetical protein